MPKQRKRSKKSPSGNLGRTGVFQSTEPGARDRNNGRTRRGPVYRRRDMRAEGSDE